MIWSIDGSKLLINKLHSIGPRTVTWELDGTNCDFPTPCDVASFTRKTWKPLFRASNETWVIHVHNTRQKRKPKFCVCVCVL